MSYVNMYFDTYMFLSILKGKEKQMHLFSYFLSPQEYNYRTAKKI